MAYVLAVLVPCSSAGSWVLAAPHNWLCLISRTHCWLNLSSSSMVGCAFDVNFIIGY